MRRCCSRVAKIYRCGRCVARDCSTRSRARAGPRASLRECLAALGQSWGALFLAALMPGAIAACKAANVRLSIGYRLHFEPHTQELKRLAKDKDFGAFMKMSGGNGFVMQRKVWRADYKLAGGGPPEGGHRWV